jgi:hypothetical protein
MRRSETLKGKQLRLEWVERLGWTDLPSLVRDQVVVELRGLLRRAAADRAPAGTRSAADE